MIMSVGAGPSVVTNGILEGAVIWGGCACVGETGHTGDLCSFCSVLL